MHDEGCLPGPDTVDPGSGLTLRDAAFGYCDPVTETCWYPIGGAPIRQVELVDTVEGQTVSYGFALVMDGEIVEASELQWFDSHMPCGFADQAIPDDDTMASAAVTFGASASSVFQGLVGPMVAEFQETAIYTDLMVPMSPPEVREPFLFTYSRDTDGDGEIDPVNEVHVLIDSRTIGPIDPTVRNIFTAFALVPAIITAILWLKDHVVGALTRK